MNTYGAGGLGPFRFGGGRRSHEEQIEAKHTSSYPASELSGEITLLLLLVWLYYLVFLL